MESPKLCRICRAKLPAPFLDLGEMALANSYVKPENLGRKEPIYPLRVFYCPECHLVQLADFNAAGEIFDEYYYFSSFSKSWLEHAKRYVDMITGRLGLSGSSHVIELASNDGYLLQYFQEKKVPVLGIEPSKTVAQAALEKKIPTEICFFGVQTAERLKRENKMADLIIGNNVLAHVPDLHDFVGGMKIALKPSGTITMEFPHLMRLLEQNQFDTVYHEHFSYLSLKAVQDIFGRKGLMIYDVEELPTHGGSLRVYAAHKESGRKVSPAVTSLLETEKKHGLQEAATYAAYSKKVEKVKHDLLDFLKNAKAEKKSVAAYGAPAKGNTLLNYCGVKTDLLEYTVDASPHKQGHLLPGSHIPIFAPQHIFETKPQYVLILPWNLKQEIMQQMQGISVWGGLFVTAIPWMQIAAQ